MRKPRAAKKPTAAETNDKIIDNLANAIVDLRANCDETRSALNSAMDTIAVLGSKIEILNAVQVAATTLESTTTKEPTAFDVSALVGVWIDEQQSEGKTTVDLARVNDIRTGIELGLSLSAGG